MPSKRTLLSLVAVLIVILGFLASAVSVYAASKEKVLHSFGKCKKDGVYPYGGLILDAAGNLYGTTGEGGTGQCKDANGNVIGCGMVFELSPGANGKWTEKVLYSFHGKDGFYPAAPLIFDASGNLYGTTEYGGADSLCDGFGCGTVFELSLGANGKWTEKVLHSFGPLPDGSGPVGSLVFDAAGNLYGTTESGGSGSPEPTGTVFKLTRDGHGSRTESVLVNFSNYEEPRANVIFDAEGNLYSTAFFGGSYFFGGVFELTSGKRAIEWLHSFNGSDGAYPTAGLIFDSEGNLYGTTTEYGDGYHWGTVFKLVRCGKDKWTEKVLYDFCPASGCADGAYPWGGVVLDAAGFLYGTAIWGGAYGAGVVFRLAPGADAKWTETVLHSFDVSDGQDPYAGLVLDGAGNLYGTTEGGGRNGKGVVFEITP